MSPRPVSSKELSREHILQAARAQFVEDGYRAVTMRSLARNLGCSHGALYYHFKDKAELYYQVIEQDFDSLLELLDHTVAEQKPGIALLQSVLVGYIRFGLENPQSYEIMFMSESCEIEMYAERDLNRCYRRFVETVQQCLDMYNEQGEHITAMLFLGLHGFVSRNITLKQSFSAVEEQAVDYTKFLLKGVHSS